MKILLKSVSWFFSVIFLLLGLMIIGMGSFFQALFVFGIALILVPCFREFIHKKLSRKIPWWIYTILGIVLWCSMILSMLLNPIESIYKSDKYRQQLQEIYDEKLTEWPTKYEEIYVSTKYGKVHVIVSGPEDGFPVLLCNASALAGWSWLHNVGELNKKYRTYAVDNIGEGGKNKEIGYGYIPQNGKEVADFYIDITEKLGFSKSHVIGASIGGFISTNYALFAPERVDKLVLLGSMGYGFTKKTILLMTLAQGFPYKFIQDATFKWAFGDDAELNRAYGKWFRIYMKGLSPSPIYPKTFSAEELKKIQVPTLAYFGTKDGVVGNVKNAKTRAENIPDIQIEVVETGHVMGIEIDDQINKEIMEFFEDKQLD